MPEVIQNWLGTTLGVLLDMSPERFGRNTKDGKLLAQLLYNYGVIPSHILKNIKESQNYYECYNNLVVLQPWLKHIGVVEDESTLQRMASGEGSAAISVFYSVYLNLERKDRLHYISAEKERRMSGDSCQKFKVNWVPESCIAAESGDSTSKLAAPLNEKRDMLQWHKSKCLEIVEQIKKTKARYQKVVKAKPELNVPVSKNVSSQPLKKLEKEAEETKIDIYAFEQKHPSKSPNLNYAELIELQNTNDLQPCVAPDISEAKYIVSSIKRRKKGDMYARNFQQKMQQLLLDEQWKEMLDKQEKDFQNAVCVNLLKQSQYEKQMTKKLYLIRNQKKILAENRRKLESLKVDQCQKEYDEVVQTNLEIRGEYWEAEEFEKERLAELHRRLYDEKARRRRAFLRGECFKIFESLMDIAIRISEVRNLIGCQVPKSFMKDLKELFFKDLPIFDLVNNYEELYGENQPKFPVSKTGEESGEVEEENENDEYERCKSEEMDRQSVLDECDFNDYINLLGPWMIELLFPNGPESEVKHLVLGYIVHKLLAIKYPPPNVRARVEIKPMKLTSIIQGLNDEAAVNMFTDIMEACKILVVKVQDAINFVLSVYKNELSVVRDIDIEFQKITEDALKAKDSIGKEKELNRKAQLLNKESVGEVTSFEDLEPKDKETQTPRVIPDDDPLLSPNAELGKTAFEALGAGDPIPDAVIVSALVSYVVFKQDEYDGWILLNYPLLYSQASDLECSLTGYRVIPFSEEMETLEETEGFAYRGPWGNPAAGDYFGQYRFSRLVPKPDIFIDIDNDVPKTYFNSFIKLKKIPETPRRRSECSEALSPLEKFYSGLDIFFNFEYQFLNFQTIKNVGKIILGNSFNDSESWDVVAKSSVEIFGSAILDLNEKWDSKRKSIKEVSSGIKKPGKASLTYDTETVDERDGEDGDLDLKEARKSKESGLLSGPPKPGDPNWEWASGAQPEGFLLALASLWENMEAIYIEDLKKLFFCLRVHNHNVISYCAFIRKSARTLMCRPDDKQKVLSDFQQMFNEIDEDLRPDVDVKCELHVRVSELEQALMSIADERKTNSLNDLTNIGQDGWFPDEMANLVNIFLSALQLEADRCTSSCQVIMDYYASMQEKSLDEKPIQKIQVPKLQIQDRKYSVLSGNSNKTASSNTPRNSDLKRSNKSVSDHSSKFNVEKSSKTRGGDKRKRSSDTGMSNAAEFLTSILTNLSLPEDGMTPFHFFFIDSVEVTINDAKLLIENCLIEAKKGDKPPATNRLTKNNKKLSETVVTSSSDSLFAEWATALENELSRFVFRAQLILARGIFEMNEFLTTMLNILSALSEDITERYLKEIQSISECCKVFRCGIEEEIQIQPVLELKGEQFFVLMDNLKPPSQEKTSDTIESSEQKRYQFTVDQLGVLFCKLQRVAPEGEIIKRSLVFIIEDLRMLKPEVENCGLFPEIWNDIEPEDVSTIMNEIYQDLEIVPWKDFIIYGLNLPLPTEIDILTMRNSFRKYDPFVTELIKREDYENITFWFEKSFDEYSLDCGEEKENYDRIKRLLYLMYQVNECHTNYSALLLAFCKDENPVFGFAKAVALAMGKPVDVSDESVSDSLSMQGEGGSFGLESFDETYEEESKKPVCCPISSAEVSPKCIPREKIVRCECKDEKETLEDKSTESEILNDEQPEAEGEYYYSFKFFQQPNAVSTIPCNILSSLLKASFPTLPQLSILLDCQQTFQETLNSVYDSLQPHDNKIEIKKFINHKFMHRLLYCTNKFKFVKLAPLLLSIAKDKAPTSRALCITEKPNVSYCLRN